MTYPPGDPGGYPSGEGQPTPPPQGYGPPGYRPPRSPWSSPLVIAAIAIGVIVVIGAALGAYWLTRGSGSEDSSTTAGASASTQTVTSTITGSGTGSAGPAGTSPTTQPTPTTSRPTPTVSGTDWQGFLSGPRCNAADDPAIVIGRTSRSQIVICQVGAQTGRWYYKGAAPQGTIEVGYPQKVGNSYVAQNGSVTYTVSPTALVITDGGDPPTTEPMLEYWTSS
ncbi:hypothetical protein ACPXB3_12450 [Gordonia sp. DT219]|uniref:hypothetical protein n=1 Tax=Gordonia sp. DT219 TaxID=3416658 RepID=UPI003CF57D85